MMMFPVTIIAHTEERKEDDSAMKTLIYVKFSPLRETIQQIEYVFLTTGRENGVPCHHPPLSNKCRFSSKTASICEKRNN